MYTVVNCLFPAQLDDFIKKHHKLKPKFKECIWQFIYSLRPLSEAGKRSFHYWDAILWTSFPLKNQNTQKSIDILINFDLFNLIRERAYLQPNLNLSIARN